MKPTIGRIVRFADTDGSEFPALVVRVFSDTIVNLQVFRDADIVTHSSVPFITPGETAPQRGWYWPPRA